MSDQFKAMQGGGGEQTCHWCGADIVKIGHEWAHKDCISPHHAEPLKWKKETEVKGAGEPSQLAVTMENYRYALKEVASKDAKIAMLREALQSTLPHLEYKRDHSRTTVGMKAAARAMEGVKVALEESK